MSAPLTIKLAGKVVPVTKDSFMVIEVSAGRVVGVQVSMVQDIGNEDNGNEDGKGEDKETGTMMDIDNDFLESLHLKEAPQESTMEVEKAIEIMESVL
ncbi:hypothetical protein C0995_009291, partial [Termitomyces sp. Mi166